MALTSRRSGPLLSRLHFLVRFLGLTGLLASLVAVRIAAVQGVLDSWGAVGEHLVDALRLAPQGGGMAVLGAYLFLGGAVLTLLAVGVELVVLARLTAARRSALGFNAFVQAALATALLVGVNVFSFQHFQRVDVTRGRDFTFSREVRQSIGRLRGETTIVVLQQRKKSELADDQFEDYDAAAEAVLIEKVRDLAEQLRYASSQKFRVVILDARKKEFRNRLEAETEDRPELARAIREAPENSLFFYAEDERGKAHVQRLPFDAFYQLDRSASEKADGGKGNLVLRYRGVEPVLRRIENIRERRPRVAVLSVHPLLSTKGTVAMFTLAGLRNTLTAHGFEVRDVLLKGDTGEPTASSLETMRVTELRELLAGLNEAIPALEEDLRVYAQMAKELPTADLQQFSRKYARQLRNAVLRNEAQRKLLAEILQNSTDQVNVSLKEATKEKGDTENELAGLDQDTADQETRLSDVGAKLRRILADCDLLLIDRFTRLPMGVVIDPGFNELYRLDDEQIAAIKDFVKTGKPVLACLGPTNEPTDDPERSPETRTDSLEDLLARLGVRLSRQTVLFDKQRQDFAEQRRRRFQRLNVTAVPPLEFPLPEGSIGPNPLGESLRLTKQTLGTGLDLSLPYPRIVTYSADAINPFSANRRQVGAALAAAPGGALQLLGALMPGPADRPAVQPEFLATVKESWNDEFPFASEKRPELRYEPPDIEDPDKGTPDERRRGPFAVGIAVETPLPPEWYSPGEGNPRTTRLAVLGSGGVFAGTELSPARQKLLLDTCNWLLGRDDLLNRPAEEWSFPRLHLTKQEKTSWQDAAVFGLPLVFAYLGLVIVLARRMR